MYAPLPPVEATPPKKTEANFPHLVAKAPKKVSPEFESSFSSTVREMAEADERDKLRSAYERDQETRAQNEFNGVYILGSIRTETSRSTVRRFVRNLNEEFDATDVDYSREEYGAVDTPLKDEDEGWATVKQKVRAPKRELTAAGLAAKYIAAGEAADREVEEFNGDLFDTRRRHEH
jgi:hypothetical protein